MNPSQTNAFGLLVIGDEILGGRRRDRHFDAIGGLLRERGFAVAWLRILPDAPDLLTSELKRSMAAGVPVFSCGGIGATPDDHTRACAARAAGVALAPHPDAIAEIEARFGAAAYPHRVKMGQLPVGSTIIPNPYNRIPGFSIKRHYFLPGFPAMAHPMAAWVLDTDYAAGGTPEQLVSVVVRGVSESQLMDLMEGLERRFPGCGLFSLPRLGEVPQIELGFRGHGDLAAPLAELMRALDASGIEFEPRAATP